MVSLNAGGKAECSCHDDIRDNSPILTAINNLQCKMYEYLKHKKSDDPNDYQTIDDETTICRVFKGKFVLIIW